MGEQRVVHCAGQTSADSQGAPLHPGDMSAQIKQALSSRPLQLWIVRWSARQLIA
jgi:enamine deaminase RidA (YjgF/YER057c/UK114 family)